MSSYPQIRLNWRRKSIAGLSFDFLFWTSISSLLKLIHIALLRWNQLARSQYSARFPLSPVPDTTFISSDGSPPNSPPGASLSEFILSLHTFIVFGGFCALFQTKTLYRHTQTEDQGISFITIAFAILAAFVGLLILICGLWNVPYGDDFGLYGLKWLDLVYWLYAVGELAELFRFIPLISTNFMCRSTAGVSVQYLAIESAGTLALVGCLIGKGANNRQWIQATKPNSLFTTAIIKVISLSKLLYQHYIVYRHQQVKSKRKYKLLPTEENHELSTIP